MSGKVKLCATCRIEGPWRYDDDGNNPTKHDCAKPAPPSQTPAEARDEGTRAAADANPAAMEAAMLVIRDTAHRLPVFSANDCRIEFEMAGVPGPVRGAAFGQAIRLHYLRSAGTEASTEASTNAHHIRIYESLIYRPGQSVAS